MDDQLGKALLRLARQSISLPLGVKASIEDTEQPDSRLAMPGAVFVTLTMQGRLRGCIGSLQAYRSLGEDCRRNAYAAAFDDPRFPALKREEVAMVQIEVSLLSKPTPFPCSSEEDACKRLQPGVDGVILECRGHRATYLPQVWDQLPDPFEFLQSLKRKAGLATDFWSKDLRLSIYKVDHVCET